MEIRPVDLENPPSIRQFLELPHRLYADNRQWVPPLGLDARRMLNLRANPFFQHSQAAFYLAVEARGRAIGRLAVLNNRRYNEYNHQNTAFFCLFECENDPGIATALFDEAFAWARSQNLDRMIGPKGFSVFDGLGLLVKGFEYRPAFGLPYNHPYYPALIETAGFQAESELVSGYLDASMEFPEKIHQIAETLKQRRGLTIARSRSRADLRALVPNLKTLYNQSLDDTVGTVPLTDEEAKTLAEQLLWFANPRLIKIVMKGDRPVGFLFAYPDISASLQRTRGRIFPLGWIDMLLEIRRTRWININGAGMVKDYRGLGGTALLFSEMVKSVKEEGYQFADLVQIGTDNERMQRELRRLGIDFYKIHRVYVKQLV